MNLGRSPSLKSFSTRAIVMPTIDTTLGAVEDMTLFQMKFEQLAPNSKLAYRSVRLCY